MAKAFSVLSWNVEHFRGKPARVPRIVEVLTTEKPDVVALFEIEGKTVFSAVSTELPGYHWHITEGPQTQEILVGVKSNKTAFFSQRTQFKSGNSFLRPGALLTITIDNENYSLLFLHLKSQSEPIGLGIRDNQLDHAFKLKRTLDKTLPDGKHAHFLILGDLNTMGMRYPFGKEIDAATELRKIDRDAGNRWNQMRRLTKTAPWTWWNGPGSSYPKADLDHVIASKHLTFKLHNDKTGATEKKDVDVRGWVDSSTDNAAKDWIDTHSDHSYLLFEVNKV